MNLQSANNNELNKNVKKDDIKINILKNPGPDPKSEPESEPEPITINKESNRDVNIGLDLLVNTDKHVQPVESPKLEVKIPSASIINDNSKINFNNTEILSPNKVWSDINSNIQLPNSIINNNNNNNISNNNNNNISNNNNNNISNNNISNIEIDIEPRIDIEPIIDIERNSNINNVLKNTDNYKSSNNINIEEIKVNKPLSPKINNPEPSEKEIYFKKIELLQRINKIKKMGYVVPELSPNDSYDTIKIEFEKLKKIKESENSIKFSRKMLLAIVTAVEFLNNKFDPFDLELNGWSESVNENVDDYDDIFEALSEKYKGTSNMSPELKLLLMLGGSGFMFHLSNSMFKKMQNPDSMINGMMGNLMGGLNQNAPNDMGDIMGMMNQTKEKPSTRKEMSGPSGVDDILNHLQSRSNTSKNTPSNNSRSRKNKSKGVSLNL